MRAMGNGPIISPTYTQLTMASCENSELTDALEYTKPLCMTSIDYAKALDLVEASAVMKALRRQGIDET